MLFGSLNRPVTITVSGVPQSGKMVIAALIADKLSELGSSIDFDLVTDNPKLKASKDEAWDETRYFVKKKELTLLGKVVHIVVED